MARQGINTGTTPNDGLGDSLLSGAIKINSNFSEVYSTFGDGTNLIKGITDIAAGTYGNETAVPQIGIDTNGKITSITNVAISGVVGGGGTGGGATGINVRDDGLVVGFAGTIDFGSNLSVSPVSAGIVTVTASPPGSGQYSSLAGVATYAVTAGYSTSSGISTYAINAGISTLAGYATTAGISTLSRGLTGTPNINVGIVTATSYIGSGSNLTGIVTSIVAGTNVTISSSTGQVTINASGGGGGSSQWSTVSSGIITSSNVGIGTTIATSKLTVVGDGSFTGIVTATQFNMTSAGTPTLSATTTLNLQAITVAISTDATIGRNLNVSGIVTASGGYNLGIQSGGININTGVITAINFIGAGNTLSYNSSTKTVSVSIAGGGGGISTQWTTVSSGIITTSNVGIKTATATDALTIVGDAKVSGVVTATRFDTTSTGTIPTIGAATTISMEAIRVAISTDATIGRNLNVSGIATVGLGSTSTPPNNSQLSFELTSNTNLRIKVRGTDGVLRTANITLA